ncbi:Polymer-forming cytoskeletal [Enhygromyxa salina]|uniref:Polymer-forming cytoskeletal n=1 Tax=Enhygromyxa salina TaxID=215803 RepID=A0A2S9YB15_9BACT|nr:polymer-forming cytoskeletal protein [Enhygromyxa salina]PRQ02300.1 Polymer-forming cytoskeletal [Enhygromyxa salina]
MAISRTISEEREGAETVVGPAIAIRGRIEGEEDLRVEGRVEGSISLTETLYVEPEGVVLAQVEARDVVISGIVIGDITAANCVTLNKAAKLVGNIAAPRVIISDGASFRGDIVMGGEDMQPTRERSRATSTVPRSTVSRLSTPAPRARAVTGSYDSARTPAPRREVVTPPARERAPVRRPTTAPPPRRSEEEDDVTVVIKHAALRKGEAPPEDDEPAKGTRRRRAKKSARTPARGRSKAGRRKS